MDEILDNFSENKKKELFTWLTNLCSTIALIGFVSMMNLFSGTIKASESLAHPSMLTISIAQLFTLASIVFLAISYIKKEPIGWKKWLATFMSLILFILVFGSVCFYYFIELSQ